MGVFNTTRPAKAYRFLHNMLNVAYLTGFVVENDKKEGWFLLQQTMNTEHAIKIYMKDGLITPGVGRAVTAICHIFSTTEDGNENSGMTVRAIEVNQANKQQMPTYVAWNGLGNNGKRTTVVPKGMRKNFPTNIQPFDESGELKSDVEATLTETPPVEITTGDLEEVNSDKSLSEAEKFNEAMKVIFESLGPKLNSSLGANANVVLISGMINKIRIIPATDKTKSYILIDVRQTANPNMTIPVRFIPEGVAPLAHHIKDAKFGLPIKIRGQVRVKPVFDAEGDICGHETFIRCHETLTPVIGVDMLKFPQWWTDIAMEMQKTRAENREKLLNAAKKQVDSATK